MRITFYLLTTQHIIKINKAFFKHKQDSLLKNVSYLKIFQSSLNMRF
jgi:hypothetical protein